MLECCVTTINAGRQQIMGGRKCLGPQCILNRLSDIYFISSNTRARLGFVTSSCATSLVQMANATGMSSASSQSYPPDVAARFARDVIDPIRAIVNVVGKESLPLWELAVLNGRRTSPLHFSDDSQLVKTSRVSHRREQNTASARQKRYSDRQQIGRCRRAPYHAKGVY